MSVLFVTNDRSMHEILPLVVSAAGCTALAVGSGFDRVYRCGCFRSNMAGEKNLGLRPHPIVGKRLTPFRTESSTRSRSGGVPAAFRPRSELVRNVELVEPI
ncbi:MAG: hypothetical protein AB7Q37_14870 [Pyrinomonadaceae bacterium]